MYSFLCNVVLVLFVPVCAEAPHILRKTIELQGDIHWRLPIALSYFVGSCLGRLFRTGLRWGPDELDAQERFPVKA